MATSERNGHHLLETTIKDILRIINPSKDDWDIRFHVINEIRAIVGSVESLRGATVEPFGSFVSNLFSKEGDLDISIDLQNGLYIFSPGRKHKLSLLEELYSFLRSKGGFRRLGLISSARIPILKFQSSFNISCDISMNNTVGQMKSVMLFWISGIDGRFRDLVLLVKEWAKAHRINDSKNGSLNSYSLALLVIFHLQTSVPAILPPLKEIYPSNMSDTLTGVRTVAVKSIEDVCAANIKRMKLDKSNGVNRSSLSDLFISFLTKLSDICSRASKEGINPFSGQLEDITSNMRWLPRTYALFIEDPFEQPVNTAKSVSSNQLANIMDSIRLTQAELLAANATPASVLSVTVMPRVSCLLVRAPQPKMTRRLPGMPAGTKNHHVQTQRKLKEHQNGARSHNAYQMKQKPPVLRGNRGAQNSGSKEGGVGESVVLLPAANGGRGQVWKPRSEARMAGAGSGS